MKKINDDLWKKRGEILRNSRNSKGLLQKDVAELLGVKNNTIAGYESGIRKMDIDTAIKLCLFLGIDLAFFLGINRNFKFVKINIEE
jgi:transcriptional regulator with XRE-family HTH domain